MKNFFDTKDEKITEKAFSQSLIISVVSILLCLVALCSMTYAWFSSDVSSSSNRLQSGTFDLSVDVVSGDDVAVTAAAIEVTEGADGSMTCTLEAPGTYVVTLKITGDTTATKGFCFVSVNGGEKQSTASISNDAEIGQNPFSFNITTTEANTTVTFIPVWGLPVEIDVTMGETLTVGAVQNDEG